jgi:ribosomal protein S18 acetylase RimI-like enzyme
VTIERTTDPDVALAWARDLLGPGSPVAFLLVPSRFALAQRDDDSFSFTLRGQRTFGAGFGPHPPVDPAWTSCVIDGDGAGEQLGDLVLRDRWDFYSRPTATPDDAAVEEVNDDDALTAFLRAHAPHSAVWPGHPEIVHWFARRDEGGLASVCAVVRWESGYHVISSVATRLDARGRGHAEALMRGVVRRLHDEGVDWVGLGVAHDNEVAQRVYRATGFTARAHFRVYAPPGEGHHH